MSLPADVRGVVERFVATASQPALLDPGEEPLPLVPGEWSLSEWNGRLVLQAWNTQRNLVRKITGIKEERSGRLALFTERFPKAQAEMQIADLAAPIGVELERKASRTAFRDRFGLILAREFPGWRIEDLSTEPNLEQSLSPAYARAFLRNASGGIAALAAPPRSCDFGGLVAFGLIWLDYLRRREKGIVIPALLLYCPAHCESEIVSRAALLDSAAVDCRVFLFDERDRVSAVDLADAGNVDSTLPPRSQPLSPNAEPPDFPALPGVDRVLQSDGAISLRVRGVEFARWTAGKLTGGIARRRRCTMEAVTALASELHRVRCETAEDRQHPLYLQFPEGWLEAQVRAHPQTIDASLLPAPLYGQVPVFRGGERGVIDLLGVDDTGRLAVIELKATADPQLPFQALDYWMRVRKHLRAGDFERLGYFPGIPLRPEDPRLVLVAPALEFHSTSETLLGFFHPGIEVVRIGLAADWRRELRVMFRLRGADRP